MYVSLENQKFVGLSDESYSKFTRLEYSVTEEYRGALWNHCILRNASREWTCIHGHAFTATTAGAGRHIVAGWGCLLYRR